MARIRRWRAEGSPQPPFPPSAGAATEVPPPTGGEADGLSAPADAQETAEQRAIAATEPPAAALPAVAPAPAGVEPTPKLDRPGFRERSRLRRRLRYLRRVRELGFRDLGGLVFDLDRFGRAREDLVRAKLDALGAVDAELRALEPALDDVRPFHELREPGIAACARCGALHGSDARFCPACGLELAGPLALGEVAGPVAAPLHAIVGDRAQADGMAVESASGATSAPVATPTSGPDESLASPATDGDGASGPTAR